MVIGSLAELKSHIKPSGNTYTIMRHGGSDSNVNNVVNADNSTPSHLTEFGRKNVAISAKKLSRKKIDIIFASPLFRTQETAEIVR